MGKTLSLPLRLASINLDGSADDHPRFPVEKNTPHKWNEKQRRFLLAARRWFLVEEKGGARELTHGELHELFLFAFSREISLTNRSKPLSKGAVSSQLYEILRDADKSSAWRDIFRRTTFRSPFTNCQAELRKIYQAGLYLEFDLVPRARDGIVEIAQGPFRLEFENKIARLAHVYDSKESHRDDSLRVAEPTTPKIAVVVPQRCPTSPSKSPPFSTPEHTATTQDSPNELAATLLEELQAKPSRKLVFRFYDSQTRGIRDSKGFLALAFANSPVPPTEANFEAFQALAFCHLRPVLHPTHFISLFGSLRPTFHRALRSTSDARIAVIDLDYLVTHRVEGRPRVFYGGDLARRLGIKGYDWKKQVEYEYRYTHEYLAWGRIEEEAIIADFSISELRNLISQRPLMSRILSFESFEQSENASQYISALKKSRILQNEKATGTEVGAFLSFAGIPEALVEQVALHIANNWRFVRMLSEHGKHRGGHDRYLGNVMAGFIAYRKDSQCKITENSTLNIELHIGGRQDREESPDTLVGNEPFSNETTMDADPAPSISIQPEVVSPAKENDFDRYLFRHDNSSSSGPSPKRKLAVHNTEESPTKRRQVLFQPHPFLAACPNTKSQKAQSKAQVKRKTSTKASASQVIDDSDTDELVHSHKSKTAPKSAKRIGKAQAPTREFSLLQLRGTHTRPHSISSTSPVSPLSSRSSSPSAGPSHHPGTGQPRASAATPNVLTLERDDFMVRRQEINAVLGEHAERRPEEWKGWRKEWKKAGVR